MADTEAANVEEALPTGFMGENDIAAEDVDGIEESRLEEEDEVVEDRDVDGIEESGVEEGEVEESRLEEDEVDEEASAYDEEDSIAEIEYEDQSVEIAEDDEVEADLLMNDMPVQEKLLNLSDRARGESHEIMNMYLTDVQMDAMNRIAEASTALYDALREEGEVRADMEDLVLDLSESVDEGREAVQGAVISAKMNDLVIVNEDIKLIFFDSNTPDQAHDDTLDITVDTSLESEVETRQDEIELGDEIPTIQEEITEAVQDGDSTGDVSIDGSLGGLLPAVDDLPARETIDPIAPTLVQDLSGLVASTPTSDSGFVGGFLPSVVVAHAATDEEITRQVDSGGEDLIVDEDSASLAAGSEQLEFDAEPEVAVEEAAATDAAEAEAVAAEVDTTTEARVGESLSEFISGGLNVELVNAVI
eukprot:GHVQ01027058.1.p1 GENE.GHVQ01027058.1~~GHVQ01027058.1.p1  ORF type:complete len:456 (-),score=150.22 GHVQ01027058.1:324-1580(-)